PNRRPHSVHSARRAPTGWVMPKPIATIRIHRLIDITLADLLDLDLMPPELASFLRAAVRAKKSIIVAGDRGAGKTTLLRALINEIERSEERRVGKGGRTGGRARYQKNNDKVGDHCVGYNSGSDHGRDARNHVPQR